MGLFSRAPTSRPALGALIAPLLVPLFLAACGLGRDNSDQNATFTDRSIAAKVNGRAIYMEDVRTHAVQRGLMREGEDLDASSDAFYFALEELIQIRLFSMEAEARGLDREPDVRRRLESARERVLAAAIYEEIDARATDPDEIERLYRENASQLGQGQEVHLRHIQFPTREAAEAAKRRLDQGERFEALAFEVSADRATAADGGDLGFKEVSDLSATVRPAIEAANVGEVVGPLQLDDTWHLFRIEDLREKGVESLETLRPRIVQWLQFQEISELQERLERDARIERLREDDAPAPAAEDVPAPEDGPSDEPLPPEDNRPGGRQAPPFPFPMGPGGVFGAQPPPPQPAAPPQAAPAAAPQAAPPAAGANP